MADEPIKLPKYHTGDKVLIEAVVEEVAGVKDMLYVRIAGHGQSGGAGWVLYNAIRPLAAEQSQGCARQITEHQALTLIEGYRDKGLAIVDAMLYAGLNWPPVCDALKHERWCSEERPCAYNPPPTIQAVSRATPSVEEIASFMYATEQTAPDSHTAISWDKLTLRDDTDDRDTVEHYRRRARVLAELFAEATIHASSPAPELKTLDGACDSVDVAKIEGWNECVAAYRASQPIVQPEGRPCGFVFVNGRMCGQMEDVIWHKPNANGDYRQPYHRYTPAAVPADDEDPLELWRYSDAVHRLHHATKVLSAEEEDAGQKATTEFDRINTEIKRLLSIEGRAQEYLGIRNPLLI
jgi:hypothetical protein